LRPLSSNRLRLPLQPHDPIAYKRLRRVGIAVHVDAIGIGPLKPAIDDSEAAREKTLTARYGRFVTSNAKVVFVVVLLLVVAVASTSAVVRLGASDQGTQPEEQTTRRA
jgi:hypothetical protein